METIRQEAIAWFNTLSDEQKQHYTMYFQVSNWQQLTGREIQIIYKKHGTGNQ